MYEARVVHLKTGKVTSRTTHSADNAAGQLMILIQADGWQGEKDRAIHSLVNGGTLRHKNFEYSVVASEGQEAP